MKAGQTNILIVEDDFDISDSFARFLRNAGYEVDEAASLKEAKERLFVRTYHVAVIDIMLAGPDRKNRDGLRVADEIRQMGEGTLAIVVSQQEDTQVAADTIQNQGVYRYLSKVTIEQQGLDALSSAVAAAAEQVSLNLFGLMQDAASGAPVRRGCLDYIAGTGSKMIVNFNKWAGLFKPLIPPTVIEEAIDAFVPLWAPILPLKTANDFISCTVSPPCLVGTFWSKAAGAAMTIVLCEPATLGRIGSESVLPELAGLTEVKSARRTQRKLLSATAFLRTDLARSDFEERMRPAV